MSEQLKEKFLDGAISLNDAEKLITYLIEENVRLKAERAWIPFDEFKDNGYEGWCQIVYKGRTTEAFIDSEYYYRFHKNSRNCYMTECISYVLPWPYIEPPQQQEEE